MTGAIQSLEFRLTKGYQEQSKAYADAIRVLESVQDSVVQENGVDEWLADLQAALNQVASVDLAMADDKSVWTESGRVPGEIMRNVLDCLGEQIRRLSGLVEARIAAMTSVRQRLVPEFDSYIQRNRMLHAYEQHGRPS